MTTEFKLRTREGHREGLEEKGIKHWADIYMKKDEERRGVKDSCMEDLKPKIEKKGCLDLDDLILVAKWTRCRNPKKVEDNEEGLVEEITAKVFTSNDDDEKIELLVRNNKRDIGLHGVGYTVASAILHWFAKDDYPIFSAPALWSCGKIRKGNGNFSLWCEYTKFCRKIAAKNNITMRTLDRALWQYSKEYQPAKVKKA